MTKPASDPKRMTPLRLGDWTVEPLRNRMHRGETVVTLEPKVMRLLVCLAARPGQVMRRQDLLAQVWDGLNVVDGAMGRAVYQLRRQLARCDGCGADVETIRQVGYRLVLTRRAPAVRQGRWLRLAGHPLLAWSGTAVAVVAAVTVALNPPAPLVKFVTVMAPAVAPAGPDTAPDAVPERAPEAPAVSPRRARAMVSAAIAPVAAASSGADFAAPVAMGWGPPPPPPPPPAPPPPPPAPPPPPPAPPPPPPAPPPPPPPPPVMIS